jgi:hypothetical protein
MALLCRQLNHGRIEVLMRFADTISFSAGNRYREHADMLFIRRGTFRMGSRSTVSGASPE